MFKCNNVYSIWDKRLVRGIKNYRRQAKQVEYKGGRNQERNTHVFSFEDKTTEMLNELGVKNMYPGILEADDVIAWLSTNIPGQKVIVSVDQDMLQLVSDDTFVYSPIKDVIIDKNNFKQKVGVSSDQFLRYKSLMGDKSDNLPGIDRCGPKTAVKLVEECKTDEELERKLGKQKLEPYYHNLEMIDLTKGHEHHPDDVVLYQEQYDKLQSHKGNLDKFVKLAESLGMKRVVDDPSPWSAIIGDEQLVKTLEHIVNNLGLSK